MDFDDIYSLAAEQEYPEIEEHLLSKEQRERVFRAATERFGAIVLGRRGGLVKSELKASAARENGKLGGRPRQPR